MASDAPMASGVPQGSSGDSSPLLANEPARNAAISFGPFRLLLPQRQLLEGERPVRIGGRALDILLALASRPGELVSKRELMDLVWPEATVVEANLAVNIQALRRAIGDGQAGARYIVNTPGRGYSFIAPVQVSDEPPTPPQQRFASRPHNLPARLTRLIGRVEEVDELVRQFTMRRLLTLVGPGGIGKTSIALDVAEALVGVYDDGVWLIDLAPVTEPTLVPTVLASALKLDVRSNDPTPTLVAALRDKQMLLVLDNCEHVIAAAAVLTEQVLKGSHRIRVLATSREPLRVEGEWIRHVRPLKCPPQNVPQTAAEALRYPAVQLFVERAAATSNEFELSDADAPSAAEICRQLDGIALAIEFAAARVVTFGVRGLAARLDRRLRFLTTGRRSALPRHQTMSAALDWSHELLSDAEKRVFRCVGVFSGSFTFGAAEGVLGPTPAGELEVSDLLLELVAKSLVSTDVLSHEPRLRLLETVRAYAAGKLADTEDAQVLRQRHAEYYLNFLEVGPSPGAGPGGSGSRVAEIENIRSALEWAFSPAGDRSLGLALAAKSAPVWLEMSFLAECRAWMEKAIANLDGASLGTDLEMAVRLALSTSLMFTRGMTAEVYETWTTVSRLAEDLSHIQNQLDSLLVLWAHQIRLPDFQEALRLASKCEAAARKVEDPGPLAMTDWMLGVTKHHLGRHADAKVHFERSLACDTEAARYAQMDRYGVDRRVAVLSILANLLWLQGYPTQALQTSAEAIKAAREVPHALPIRGALFWAGLNTYMVGGDAAIVERYAAELVERTGPGSSNSVGAEGVCLKGLCHLMRGEVSKGASLLSEGLSACAEAQYEVYQQVLAGDLATAMAADGRLDEGLSTISELERDTRNPEHWGAPEILRVKGELLLTQSETNAAAAEGNFRRALDWARRQGALSWELRSATSLAKLLHRQGRRAEARDLLEPAYARFTEGFETMDLLQAKEVLRTLS